MACHHLPFKAKHTVYISKNLQQWWCTELSDLSLRDKMKTIWTLTSSEQTLSQIACDTPLNLQVCDMHITVSEQVRVNAVESWLNAHFSWEIYRRICWYFPQMHKFPVDHKYSTNSYVLSYSSLFFNCFALH